MQPDRFEGLVRGYFKRRWENMPTEGSAAGVYRYDELLEVPSTDHMASALADVRRAREELSRLEPPPGSDQDLDRRVFCAMLQERELLDGRIQLGRRDLLRPVQAVTASIFNLLMRRNLDEPDTVNAIVKRLNRFDQYLAVSKKVIDEPAEVWFEAAKEAVSGAIRFIGESVPGLGERHPALSESVTKAVARAQNALLDYGRWLDTVHDKCNPAAPAIGADNLQCIIRDVHGLQLTVSEVVEAGWELIQYYHDELNELARQIAPGVEWKSIVQQARAAFAASAGDLDLVGAYSAATVRLRRQLQDRRILDIPENQECRVIPTPPFLCGVISNAWYCAPGPMDQNQVGLFFVTTPSPDLSEEARNAQVGQHWGFELACAHEAYPGHHVQRCYANRNPRPVRKMARFSIFEEGWPMYCEHLLDEMKCFDSPTQRLGYLADQLWRAYRVIIDVGIHTGTKTINRAIQILVDGVGFTRRRASSELNWYLQHPGKPMSFALGRREIMTIRESYLKKTHSTLNGFHSWILSFGSIQTRWLTARLPARPC